MGSVIDNVGFGHFERCYSAIWTQKVMYIHQKKSYFYIIFATKIFYNLRWKNAGVLPNSLRSEIVRI